jgi:hypothetical protein
MQLSPFSSARPALFAGCNQMNEACVGAAPNSAAVRRILMSILSQINFILYKNDQHLWGLITGTVLATAGNNGQVGDEWCHH